MANVIHLDDSDYLSERVGVCSTCNGGIDVYSSVMADRHRCTCPVMGKTRWLGYPPPDSSDLGAWRKTFR